MKTFSNTSTGFIPCSRDDKHRSYKAQKKTAHIRKHVVPQKMTLQIILCNSYFIVNLLSFLSISFPHKTEVNTKQNIEVKCC